MKKIKITESQYKKLLSEIEGIKGGINRVDKTFVKTFRNADVKKLEPNPSMMEDENGTPFNIKDPIPNVPNSKMKKTPEPKSPIDEDIFSPEFHQAIHSFIQNIWMNPSQKHLDRVFVENGVTWGDIATYLTSIGVLGAVGAGMYKVKNFFKTKFSPDQEEAMQQKMQDIEKLTKMVEKDPVAPWNQGEETTYEKKQKMQARPEVGWEAKPKPFSPIKAGLSEDEPESVEQIFKPVGMNKDFAILNGPDGMYLIDLELNHIEDRDINGVAKYVNTRMKNPYIGNGIKDFDNYLEGDSPFDLLKIDEKLKELLIQLHRKDQKFVSLLSRLEETGAASAGAFTGAMSTGKPQVSPGYSPADIINDEDAIYGKKIQETDTAGTPQSSATGQYTQPKVWAKNKANWAASKRTQYPHGEMVDFDPCTRLNNNKSAENGKCSQGAVDKVVKTHTTPQSVISKTVYEEVAKRTGRSLDEVKRIIQTKNKKG